LRKFRRTGKAYTAKVIGAAGVRKRPPANIAQRVSNKVNLPPASGAKTLRVGTVNATAAAATPRRVKPIDQPVETLGDAQVRSCAHKTMKL
jgi:hypothetical protein